MVSSNVTREKLIVTLNLLRAAPVAAGLVGRPQAVQNGAGNTCRPPNLEFGGLHVFPGAKAPADAG